MKPKVKKLWTKALRSGCYRKVCGVMRNVKIVESSEDEYPYEGEVPDMSPKNTSMCVMGVLADVALRESGLLYNQRNWLKFARDNEDPTERLRNWAGLTNDEVQEMIDNNDEEGWTFKQFADHIDEKF